MDRDKALREIIQNQHAILAALAAMSEVPGDERRACRQRSYDAAEWLNNNPPQKA